MTTSGCRKAARITLSSSTTCFWPPGLLQKLRRVQHGHGDRHSFWNNDLQSLLGHPTLLSALLLPHCEQSQPSVCEVPSREDKDTWHQAAMMPSSATVQVSWSKKKKKTNMLDLPSMKHLSIMQTCNAQSASKIPYYLDYMAQNNRILPPLYYLLP